MTRKGCSGRAVLSLFTGAGGLDLGLEAAGFSTRLCVEIDDDACETLRINRPKWQLATPGDIHALEPENILAQANLKAGEVILLAGGPPCQPFSKSAYWAKDGARGLLDPRAKTLDAYLEVVEAARPQVILLENVKGLAAKGKNEGLQLLQDGLKKINRRNKTKYQLQVLHLNAASYGVPQFRERIFILATVDGRKIDMPHPTHGTDCAHKPFLTAWDAIGDLDRGDCSPDLEPQGKWAGLLRTIPEGQNYLWHTPRGSGESLFGWRTRYWSFLLKLAKSQPSWTIQALPGPATGPFHWGSRLLSTEELARLQTFPRGYRFEGDRRSAHRQIGNAVPCAIGELVGLEIRRQILGERVRRSLRFIPERRDDCPPPHQPEMVPRKYLKLRAAHQDHPGAGLGPGARTSQGKQVAP